MRIGELSARTGASPRSLRYYEQQGLLSSERQSNGYREYGANAVAMVQTIRSLLDIGLPTALVKDVLPCTVGEKAEAACPELLERIAVLRDDVRSRAARFESIDASLTSYLSANAQASPAVSTE
ncbi:MerR family transcriptional regulator [Bogoriella caseilytica]|uniref:DNA-binding transcriptional MerR regulator n=1 Tax=Bogoriella caseilytica TaxID=56055 RepID=A0A3N2BB61_9MICO|nr:MerR family transcriptional regulator [Bogoriella caseilytica]ROR72503.1 DNA-binding transcriptional MerR regulator [Bogoriella caseilytica]